MTTFAYNAANSPQGFDQEPNVGLLLPDATSPAIAGLTASRSDDKPLSGDDSTSARNLIEAAIQVTKEVFGCEEVLSEVLTDPDADESFLVFKVDFHGSAEDAVSKRKEWHRRMGQLHRGECPFRLSIH